MQETKACCDDMVRAQIIIDNLTKEFDKAKDEMGKMHIEIGMVKEKSATLEIRLEGMAEDIKEMRKTFDKGIEAISVKFDKATWWIIGMFGTILVGLIVSHYIK